MAMRSTSLTILLMVLLWAGCEEPFPWYEEPTDVLVASIAKAGSDTLYIVRDSGGATISMNPIRLSVFVKNTYTQLLQGSAQVTGTLNVIMTAPAPFAFPTTQLARSDLITPFVYHDSTALPPGASAEFRAYASGGIVDLLEQQVPYTERVLSDSTKVRTYAPVTFQAEAEVRLFERVQPIRTKPFVFTQTYVQLSLPKDGSEGG
jgi:hypothetical protein